MQSLNQLKDSIRTIESIRLITQAFGDIATFKIKATRKSKEHNIAYFQEIHQLYTTVKAIASQNRQLSKNKPKSSGKDRVVCVLLSANSHFYGNLDYELTRFFINNTLRLDCDRIVVGSFANQFLKTMSYPHPFKKIIFKKDSPSLDELANLSREVFTYKRILVYHTKFVTILNQEPFISDISPTNLEIKEIKLPFHYIAEPEIDKILDFFDSQMAFLMFEAIFLEIDYCRLAARMISMNQAEENADKLLRVEQKQLLKFRKQKANLEILETYAGMVNKDLQRSQ